MVYSIILSLFFYLVLHNTPLSHGKFLFIFIIWMINHPNGMVDSPVNDRDFCCSHVILENSLKTMDFLMNFCGKPSLFHRALTQNAN